LANAFVHSKLSTIQFGGTYFAGLTISYNETLSDLSDITFTQSGGATWAVKLPEYNMAKGEAAYVYDTLNQPTVAGNLLQVPGTLMTMIMSPDGTKFFSFNAYSAELDWNGGPQTKGPVGSKTAFESTGTVTRPTS
jgi:hypothetical protein